MIDFGVVNILLTSMSVSSQHDVAHVHPPPDLLTMVLWQDSPSLVMVRMRMGVVWREVECSYCQQQVKKSAGSWGT